MSAAMEPRCSMRASSDSDGPLLIQWRNVNHFPAGKHCEAAMLSPAATVVRTCEDLDLI